VVTAVAEGDGAAAAAAHEQQQQQQQHGEAAAVVGPRMQLLQASSCHVGGVNLGGICVAVALCASAGYAAAAITCGQVSTHWLARGLGRQAMRHVGCMLPLLARLSAPCS
jgi:hypothetical protein